MLGVLLGCSLPAAVVISISRLSVGDTTWWTGSHCCLIRLHRFQLSSACFDHLGSTWLPFQWPSFSEINYVSTRHLSSPFMRCAFPFPGSFGHDHLPAGQRSTAACFALRIGGDLWGGSSCNPAGHCVPVTSLLPSGIGHHVGSAGQPKGPACKRRRCTRTSTQDPQPTAPVREWCGRRDCGSAVIPRKGSCMCAT